MTPPGVPSGRERARSALGAVGVRLMAIVAVSAALAGLIACGGAAPSGADFLTQANAECKRINDQVAAHGQARSAADVARIAPQILTIERGGLDRLRRLTPPDTLRPDWRVMLTDLNGLIVNVAALLAAARTQDTAAAARVAAASQRLQTTITAVGNRDGLSQCARG